ncbi:divalent cation tolerance protein CutA [Actinoallomurus sp. NPDC052274]|uniref:divalent-cation tolerance protein CutA n=1 Tax=Actinoallomurus sp. NPDC052274 TaxID=3155420 RepID=UPI00343BB534
MTGYVQVSTAAGSRDAAISLLNSAVKAKLAASGQVSGPLATAFWHLGEFGTGEEWQIILKTTKDCYPDLEAHLIAAHPWDNPEVSFTPLGGSEAYLEWVTRATS